MEETKAIKKLNRDISWLAFNHRVLQEAADKTVPLYERIKFLAIYSSNLDEFFRVRVASLRNIIRLKKKKREKLGLPPKELLAEIIANVDKHQQEFGRIYREEIVKECAEHGVLIKRPEELDVTQRDWVRKYFEKEVRRWLNPSYFEKGLPAPFLKNRGIYFAIRLAADKDPSIIKNVIYEIPTGQLRRFVVLPDSGGKANVMWLDDIIRSGIPSLFFGYNVLGCYCIKVTRDAELYLGEEFTGNFLKQIKKALKNRDIGTPTRLLHDETMPADFVEEIRETFGFSERDLISGGRYHNNFDMFNFPNPGNRLPSYEDMPPLPHPELAGTEDLLSAIREKDRLLHFPYQSFDTVVKFLESCAEDDDVTAIRATLYRVAKDSAIAKALIRAAKKGKKVTTYLEIKARFDEESNLYWLDEFKKAGIEILETFDDLKVHAKLLSVTRNEDGAERNYAYLGTGNFNEKTARIYVDNGILTAGPLADEVVKVFNFIADLENPPPMEHLLVAPYLLQKKLIALIKKEIEFAKQGKEASIYLKLNALEDDDMINILGKAAKAGVKIRMMVRGICRMIPELPEYNGNIEARSIVDRYLEHTRVYWFQNDGDEKLFLASADLMERNLKRRIEVAFPVYQEELKEEIKKSMEIQWADTTHARVISEDASNENPAGEQGRRAQYEIYDFLKSRSSVGA